MKKIIVVTAAYGQQTINALGGQQALLPIIAAAGAHGVEIRRELFSAAELTSLPALGDAITSQRLSAFYSVPEALFMADGSLNPQLTARIAEARQFGATLIKFALGHYQPGISDDALQSLRVDPAVQLVVENDQTVDGRLTAISDFIRRDANASAIGGLTFDTGNWLWVGDDPQAAARQLSPWVSYIHVKAAEPHQQSYRAVALDDSDGSWRPLLQQLPDDVPRGIEFPLVGDDLIAVTRHYVNLLSEE